MSQVKIGDLLKDSVAKHAAQDAATSQAAAADQALADAKAAAGAADTLFGAELPQVGFLVVPDADGVTFALYTPDGQGGFHRTAGKGPDALVDVPDAPPPAPPASPAA